MGFSWVIPKQLAGTSLPGRIVPLERDLTFFREQNVTLLVTAMREKLPEDVIAAHGLSYYWVSIGDFLAPTMAQLDDWVTRARAEIDGGGAVCVHCFAGRGRTGTLLAAYLIAGGATADDAMAEIRAHRPGSIESWEQEEALYEFAKTR